MLKHGTTYIDVGQDYHEERYRSQVLHNLKRKTREMGFELVEVEGAPAEAAAK